MFIVRGCRASLVLLALFAALRYPALIAAQSIAPRQWDRIQVSSEVQPEVERLLLGSPTFRSQYQRIAATQTIRVGVRLDPAPDAHFKARSTFRRYGSGLIVVIVLISPGAGQPEWIAHEFEHILEQLDGVNLPALAGGRGHGVWYSGDHSIETRRAIRAGRMVREELHRPPIHESDNFVQ